MPKPPLMERSIFALTHILVEALPDIRWTRLMALRTGNFMARKLLSNAQAIASELPAVTKRHTVESANN